MPHRASIKNEPMRQKKMDAWAHNLLRLLLNLTQELQIHVAVVDGGGKALGCARILLDRGAAADGEGSVAVVDDGDPAAGGGEVKGEIRSPAQQRAHHAGIGGAAVEPGQETLSSFTSPFWASAVTESAETLARLTRPLRAVPTKFWKAVLLASSRPLAAAAVRLSRLPPVRMM